MEIERRGVRVIYGDGDLWRVLKIIRKEGADYEGLVPDGAATVESTRQRAERERE